MLIPTSRENSGERTLFCITSEVLNTDPVHKNFNLQMRNENVSAKFFTIHWMLSATYFLNSKHQIFLQTKYHLVKQCLTSFILPNFYFALRRKCQRREQGLRERLLVLGQLSHSVFYCVYSVSKSKTHANFSLITGLKMQIWRKLQCRSSFDDSNKLQTMAANLFICCSVLFWAVAFEIRSNLLLFSKYFAILFN